MLYNICIFDLDGTLTDPIDGIIKGLRYTMEKLGIEGGLENPGRFVGPPLNESFEKAFNMTAEQSREAVDVFREYYGETGIYENEVYPGVVQMLDTLSEKGAKLGVATTKPDNFARLVLRHFDLYKYFDIIKGDTHDAALSRGGKQGMINIVLDALDPQREKPAVMVGDRKHDILGARASGIDSIGITWGYGPLEELEEAGAVKIANSPEEVLRLVLSK